MNSKNKIGKASRWDLMGCALRGHETYEPTGSIKAELFAKKLSTKTQHGTTWLCLRCGSYIIGEPRYVSPLKEAPLIIRGGVLKQTIILRFLAIERGLRAVLLIGAGLIILHFKYSRGGFQQLLQTDLPAIRDLAHSVGYNLDSSTTFHSIQHTLSLNNHSLNLAALFVFAYAAILGAEAIGLWLIKRWGEYFSAIATSVFIPLEIYELSHHITVLKSGALIINIAAVLYLVITKRLFGVRGGGKAYEANLEGDNLLEITKAAS